MPKRSVGHRSSKAIPAAQILAEHEEKQAAQENKTAVANKKKAAGDTKKEG